MNRTAHDLLASYLFSAEVFEAPVDVEYTAPASAPSIFDTPRSARFSASERFREELALETRTIQARLVAPAPKEPVFGPQLPGQPAPARCTCEQDERCVLYYNWIERGSSFGPAYGFDLSDEVLEWLPQYVADVEANCPATLHYGSLMLDEELARDTTTQGEDESDVIAYWDAADEFLAAYGHRTEEGGRWIETHDGSDLAADRDREDWTTQIRCHEMAKKRELRDWMLSLGLSPSKQAPWVAERITLKRQDALREKALAEKKSYWTESFPLPPESQIRLRAYASCLASLQKPSGFAQAQSRER